MKALKVSLYIRVRVSRRKYSFVEPAWNKNRSLRAGCGLVNGQLEFHPEGIYYLRYLRGTKRVWHAVGADADVALVALRNKEHDLQAVRLGRSVEERTSQPISRLGLGSAIESYLGEIRRSRSAKTIAACNRILGVFGSRLSWPVSRQHQPRASVGPQGCPAAGRAQPAHNLQPHHED